MPMRVPDSLLPNGATWARRSSDPGLAARAAHLLERDAARFYRRLRTAPGTAALRVLFDEGQRLHEGLSRRWARLLEGKGPVTGARAETLRRLERDLIDPFWQSTIVPHVLCSDAQLRNVAVLLETRLERGYRGFLFVSRPEPEKRLSLSAGEKAAARIKKLSCI